ncbi:MAG: Maf family nucleotide pyrophosphatase [Prevotellaceae bacterium]|jgi:septum formation protein|nr:Maf family nucleotide pyrophosphatase [Prevotellaceae bacterium]
MLLDTLKGKNIILGSQSPRRAELLKGLDLSFTLCADMDADESRPDDLSKNGVPAYISEKKSNAYPKELGEDDILITADTIVWIDDEVLNKPSDRNDAIRMLNMLSGRMHEVITAVTLRSKDKMQTFIASTFVHFRPLEDEEIEYYVDNYHPYDKAGAYGIQEWLGFIALERIEGSYFNVMGLPVQRLYVELAKFTNTYESAGIDGFYQE